MGSVLFHPKKQMSLITSKDLLLHGGLGTSSPSNYYEQFYHSSTQGDQKSGYIPSIDIPPPYLPFSDKTFIPPPSIIDHEFFQKYESTPLFLNGKNHLDPQALSSKDYNQKYDFYQKPELPSSLPSNGKKDWDSSDPCMREFFQKYENNPRFDMSPSSFSYYGKKDFDPKGLVSWRFLERSNNFGNFELISNLSYQEKFHLPCSYISPNTLCPDVRLEHKNSYSSVADPVDIITGAFYIDETDLQFPGPFPLEIRRNYNSQNPVIGDFGHGWKLSLNPYLINQEGKLYASEMDGTVIVYRLNPEKNIWEVLPEDNPDLSNFSQKGIGSIYNPFHGYIQNDILYSPDGSKRVFVDGLLKQWISPTKATLTFSYHERKLTRIESSNGSYCGFTYNHEGKIAEIYSQDGRWISYRYNSRGDLIGVILPNSATTSYEYDRNHRIFRETKPHGNVLENIFDDQGRVLEQRSPLGPLNTIIPSATFSYQEGITTVTDANGGITTYKIYQKQIYKIIDPLGQITLQSWFLDENHWFDADTETLLTYEKEGGYLRSLKSLKDRRGLITSYSYDKKGNPIEIKLMGEDLTGDGKTEIRKDLTYNDNNLCTQEKILDRTTVTTYSSSFPYLPCRVESYIQEKLLSSSEWQYDEKGQLVEENHIDSLTIWDYDNRGLAIQKTRKTQTDDPDVVSRYVYNNQGQCIQIEAEDFLQKNDFDITGNLIHSETYSHLGTLISRNDFGYNLNNGLIWTQAANPQNITYFDYLPSGQIKASRKVITPSQAVAYTLYEYDAGGYPTKETDPLGNTTYKEYDLMGRVIRETKENCSTLCTYEPGGLIETVVSPSKATTTRHYTQNGLLKEEINPDGTVSSFIYDFFGRVIQETKNKITWQITYDDLNHKIIKTHLETLEKEIHEFDARGNLIRFTDAAGFTTENSYDGLNRLKVKISPSQDKTFWNYEKDRMIVLLPNEEKIIQRLENGKIVESKVYDSQGILISSVLSYFDPETEVETILQGDVTTTSWISSQNLPIKTQSGSIVTTYEYDLLGNCTSITDGDGNTSHQQFDALKRLIQKTLPDGSQINYFYDENSNLVETHLPGGVICKASYDQMGRKNEEELFSKDLSSQKWEYFYDEGYLTRTIDPLNRMHEYRYDSHGRVVEESVERWKRSYSYDPRGLILSADQEGSIPSSWLSSFVRKSHEENSHVERAYDCEGRLTEELIYLNSTLLQHSHQSWSSSSRSLQIDNHMREWTYQNQKIIHVRSQDIDLSYNYNLAGSLTTKTTPLSRTSIEYSNSLPSFLQTQLRDHSYEEKLEWSFSGKLNRYLGPRQDKTFSYSPCGYLQAAGDEAYEYDFGQKGTGIRTGSSHSYVADNGLDDFSRVTSEKGSAKTQETSYNLMGEVVSQDKKQFFWDPWGRLLKVSDSSSTWESSYDAFGRRLQTRYSQGYHSTKVTTSLYDPEEEFLEIGIKTKGKTFWKIFGPSSCDALCDEKGAALYLMHNGLDQLEEVVSSLDTLRIEKHPSSYGEQKNIPSFPSDLISYAKSLTWHSKAQDPTGLIWMGKRYYDPKKGRFLSPDPMGYPACLDLYVFAGGDPVNYFDPDGRFASQVYKTIPEMAMDFVKYPFETLLHLMNGGPNLISQCCYNWGFTRSHSYEIGSLGDNNVFFVNGINVKKKNMTDNPRMLSEMEGDRKISYVYNASNWIGCDLLESGAAHLGVIFPQVYELNKQWNHFFATHGPEAKLFQICHSEGTEVVKNLLLLCPKSIRKRVIVLAIAPAVIIPNALCFKSDNYASKHDGVFYLDAIGNALYGNELKLLDPHPDAPKFDHDFQSPTFRGVIKYYFDEFHKNYGDIK